MAKKKNPEAQLEAQQANRAVLETALQNPNVQQYLNVIALSEGTIGNDRSGDKNGYDIGFNYTTIPDFNAHPGTTLRRSFTNRQGKTQTSTAAGRYQFMPSTWKGLANQLGLTDFGPQSQDLGALQLIREKGALNDIIEGKFDNATRKLGGTWTSLPSGGAGGTQNTRSWDAIRGMYESAKNYGLGLGTEVPLGPRDVFVPGAGPNDLFGAKMIQYDYPNQDRPGTVPNAAILTEEDFWTPEELAAAQGRGLVEPVADSAPPQVIGVDATGQPIVAQLPQFVTGDRQAVPFSTNAQDNRAVMSLYQPVEGTPFSADGPFQYDQPTLPQTQPAPESTPIFEEPAVRYADTPMLPTAASAGESAAIEQPAFLSGDATMPVPEYLSQALPSVQDGQQGLLIPESATDVQQLRRYDPYDEVTRGALARVFDMLQQSGVNDPVELFGNSSYPDVYDDELLRLIEEA